jgi:ATP-binding cassette subfamily C protein
MSTLDRPVRAYVSALLRVMPGRVVLAAGLMVLVGLTEGLGILLLLPLLNLAGVDVERGSVAALAARVSSIVAALRLPHTLPALLVLFVAVMGAQALIARWQAIVTRRIEFDFAAHLRERLYRAIVESRWSYFARQRAADFAHALTAEIDRAAIAAQFLLGLAATGLVMAVYLGLAMRLSASMTILVTACAALLLLALRGLLGRARRAGRRVSESVNELYATTLEHLGGMKTIKSYGAEPAAIAAFRGVARASADRHLAAIRNYATLKAWSEAGAMVVLAALLYVSLTVVRLTTAEILLLIFLFARVMPRAAAMQQYLHHFLTSLPSFASIQRAIDSADAARDGTVAAGAAVSEAQAPPAIRFDAVSFAYSEGGPLALREVTAEIGAGAITVVIGPSGSGKSTLADLAMGLLAPSAGAVRVDGRPMRELDLRAWRRRIGYVAQEPFLFHDSIRANLRWGNVGAADDDIEAALRAASAHELVMRAPGGLEAVVGDRGGWMSGGERQRLALARALVGRPSVLILDEATSNLDEENERQILEALARLRGAMTILLVTHRAAALGIADVVVALDEGRLAASTPRRQLDVGDPPRAAGGGR